MKKTESKIKGIPFGVLLAGKVHDGAKTVTRRVVKMDVMKDSPKKITVPSCAGEFEVGQPFRDDAEFKRYLDAGMLDSLCPYQVGQLLYVREPWQAAAKYDKPSGSAHIPNDGEIAYLSDNGGTRHEFGGRRRIARFMPKRFARTFIRVTGLRCERLLEITEEDAVREGIDTRLHPDDGETVTWRDYRCTTRDKFVHGSAWGPKESFLSLWDAVNGKDAHLQNPWVWVIEVEKVEMPNPWNESVPMVVLSSYGMASWDHPITKMGYVVNVTAAVGGWVWKIDRTDLRTVRKSVLLPTEKEAIHDLNRFLRLSILNPVML